MFGFYLSDGLYELFEGQEMSLKKTILRGLMLNHNNINFFFLNKNITVILINILFY